jgi:hypothetical protein
VRLPGLPGRRADPAGVTDVRHCNACGQPATSEDPAVGQIGPLLVLMVLCDTCADETVSLSA